MKTILVILSLNIIACSSVYKKTISTSLAAGALGAVYGSTKEDYKNQNAALYGALSALAAGAVALSLDVDELKASKNEAESLRVKLNQFEKRLEPKLIASGNSLFNSPLPREVSGLIEPGEWKKYKMDEWVQDQNDQNSWVRQIERIEFVLPGIK